MNNAFYRDDVRAQRDQQPVVKILVQKFQHGKSQGLLLNMN